MIIYKPIAMVQVAIIGSLGYIGSKLAAYLVSQGCSVHGYDVKRSEEEKGSRLSETELAGMDAVVFLGGINGRVGCSEVSEETVRTENVEEPLKVLEKLRGNTLFVYASTLGILEGSGKNAADESFVPQDELLDSYTRSMLEREQAVCASGTECKTVGLRFGTVIGITDSESQRRDLMHLAMIRTGFSKGYIPVQNPACRRAFVGLEDLCRTVYRVVTLRPVQANQHEIYHVSGFNASVQKVGANIASVTKFPIRYFGSGSVGGAVGFSSVSRKIQEHYGFKFVEDNGSLIVKILENLEHVMEYKDTHVHLDHCLVCKNQKLTQVLDLGDQCLANSYRENTQEPLVKYPLQLMRCPTCSHLQLSYIVSREELFRDYIYVSGTSRTLVQYFEDFARSCVEDLIAEGRMSGEGLKVLEIACNDGSQLDKFRDLGFETYGVDPAANIMSLTREKGHHAFVGFWGKEGFNLPQLDLIVAQNVLAHVDDPRAFVKACAEKMTKDTTLYIQTSQCDLIQNGEFDSIYHEHVSFFTVRSMRTLLEQFGLALVDVRKTEIHGRSYVFKVKVAEAGTGHGVGRITPLEIEEEQLGLYKNSFYWVYHQHVQAKILFLRAQLKALQKTGHKMIVYGAAAKGMTLLGALDLKAHGVKLDYIVDDAVSKHFKYAPEDTQVLPVNYLGQEREPFCLFVLAWNFKDEILRKVRELHPRMPFYYVLPFPEPSVYYSRGNEEKCLLQLQNQECGYFMPERPSVNLVTHIFNEELLLPYYIQHYAHLVDHAVVLDNESTDRSREILEEDAPDTWSVKETRNKIFAAIPVDDEVIEYERQFGNSWKTTPTITEFFFCPNMYSTLRKYNQDGFMGVQVPLLVPNGRDDIPFMDQVPLPIQRCRVVDPVKYIFETRVLHCAYMEGNNYSPGRHRLEHFPAVTSPIECMYLKYKNTPWPDVLDRRVQMRPKLPEEHHGMGFYHYFNREEMIKDSTQIHGWPSFNLDYLGPDDSDEKIRLRHLWYNHMFSMGDIEVNYSQLLPCWY